MEALDAILKRSSAARLAEPAPTPQQLDLILEAGKAAPDHGRLQPWRFVILEGAARTVLAETMAALRREKSPDATDEMLAQERAKAFRAPTIIVAAAAITEGRIPPAEQFAAVAAATQNMFLAAFALGLGAMWKTGDAAYHDGLKSALGLGTGDQIVAFLYLGTTADNRPPMPKKPKDVVRRLPA